MTQDNRSRQSSSIAILLLLSGPCEIRYRRCVYQYSTESFCSIITSSDQADMRHQI